MVLCGALGPDLSPGAPRHFAWQAWHLVTFTFVSCGRRGTQLTSTVVLRGRRGTHGTVWRAWSGFVARGAAAFCVAGVALGDIHLRFMWQAWHTTHIHRRFAWQAWDRWHWVARVVRLHTNLTYNHFTYTNSCRRGTMSHLPSFCVAGVGQMVLGGALGPDLSPCVCFSCACLHRCRGAVVDKPRGTEAWQAWH